MNNFPMLDDGIRPGAVGNTPLPSALNPSGVTVPKPPTPSYSGSNIVSMKQAENTLGMQTQYDPTSGMVWANNTPIKPTSVSSGSPNVRMTDVANAIKYSSNAVHQNGNNVTVYPANNQSSQYQQDVQTYGKYNADVLSHGAFRDPTAYGETVDQAKQHEAKMYGIDPSLVQVTAGGHTYVDPKYVRAYLERINQPQQPQQPSYQDQLNNMGQQFLGQVTGSMPQAPQLPQIPAFDPNSIKPFQFDMGQDALNVYGALNPTYQQMIGSEDQRINDQMNARGMYNSGVAQQAVNMQNQGIYGKEMDAMNKQINTDRTQQFNEYKTYVGNQLQAYKDNVDAAYKAGQLTNQQYADAINEWGKQVGAAQNVFDQMAKQLDQQQAQDFNTWKSLIPYNYGPTPYQQQQLDLNQLKTILPYQMPTAYQQGQLSLGQQKLQAQVQQWQAQDLAKQEEIMGYDTQGDPTLARQKYDEQVQYDQAKMQDMINGVSDSQTKMQLSGLNTELNSLNAPIQAAILNKDTASLTQLMNQRKSIIDTVDSIVNSLGASGDQSFASGNGPLAQPN